MQIDATAHADAMQAYIREGTQRALSLPNRGPILLDDNGKLVKEILDAYWEYGFYVFTGVVGTTELGELRADVERVLNGAPAEHGGELDASGQPAIGCEFKRSTFRFAEPLADPVGGTDKNKGRHPVRMLTPKPAPDAPPRTISNLAGNLQIMDSCLRLYGHPGLLAVAEAVLGPDFVPYNEVAFIKEPGLGPSVAWHRDGTTHWEADDWDRGAHGFNFMVQLYPSTPGNGVWVLPRSHRERQLDIKDMVARSGSERIEGTVPLICEGGDAFIVNRQMLHGSFANTSAERRITLNEGFFPRRRIENVTTSMLDGEVATFDPERIHQRSRIIQLAIDARHQRFPDEAPYRYQPFADEADTCRWNEAARESILKDYNLLDMYI